MEVRESRGELNRDNEERIFVSVRLRPLNNDEISSNDVSDWECINSDTIVYKNASLHTCEGVMYPSAYTFDRVFRSDCTTRTVYEQGAKNIATSVVRGVNSTIFAYGQTSSGKTYTMTGITECAIADIYDYIHKHPEREFVLKFSAMEIYNESVRDLLRVDNTSLRILDDPERGTIVEHLTEEILRDQDHATELLFFSEAQRRTEETLLNDMSSLSHQIIRLTIESSPREFLGRDNASMHLASVNFVDLAGSERASQSLSGGTRSKEGSHIDRSLLTLETVIHKLSKDRNSEIPYKDSKLTQILETSLQGHGKTAIICTVSPTRSHVKQSRNTLVFASCAKEVTTNAHVNIVMSDKAVVKQLQKELARLENELRSSHSRYSLSSYTALLREKDAQIEKLEKEVKDLILQRDIYESRVKELSRMVGDDASSITQERLGNYPHLRVQESPDCYNEGQEIPTSADPQCLDVETKTCSDDLSRSSSQNHTAKMPFFYDNFEHINVSPSILPSSSNFSECDSFYGWQDIEKQMNSNLEDLCRQVQRIETEHSRNSGTTDSFPGDNAQFPAIKVHVNRDEQLLPLAEDNNEEKKDGQELISVNDGNESTLSMFEEERDSGHTLLRVARSQSCDGGTIVTDSASPWFKMTDYSENTPSVGSQIESESKLNYRPRVEMLPENDCQSRMENALDMEIDAIAETFSTAEDFTSSTPDMRKNDDLPNEQKVTVKSEEDEQNFNEDPAKNEIRGFTSWPVEFRRLQREIIELWHACNISLIHRTYFFMLFQGDPADAISLEVEIRRMKSLKDKFSRGDKVIVDGRRLTLSSSAKALRQERRTLSEQMMKKFSEQEREELFVKWGIGLNTKLRRLQLANQIWSKTEDMNHVEDSAFLVAKLVGFIEPEQTPSRDMLGLNITPKCSTGIGMYKRSLGSIL